MSWLRRKSPEEKRAMKEVERLERAAEVEAWVLHKQRMEKAAGISSVAFICHPETWDFIYEAAHDHRNFSTERQIEARPDGLVSVPVSGPSLVAIFEVLRRLQRNQNINAGSQMIAKRIYDLVGVTVDAVNPEAKLGAPVPPVVIDAKHGTPDPSD